MEACWPSTDMIYTTSKESVQILPPFLSKQFLVFSEKTSLWDFLFYGEHYILLHDIWINYYLSDNPYCGEILT